MDSPPAIISPAVPADSPAALQNYLATNAAAHARGYVGNSADTVALAHWNYALYTGTNLTYLTNATWSQSFWLHGVRGLSATCIGFSNSLGGQGLITMISPRHYLCMSHMHPENLLAAFLDTNNVVHWRKTVARGEVSKETSVGILDSDLPPSVGFLPILPANYSTWLPTSSSVVIQGIGMNQDMRIFGLPMTFAFPPYIAWDPGFSVPDGLDKSWNAALRGGDSSNPVRLLIGNELVLAAENYSINAGPNFALNIDAINQRMHELSTRVSAKSDYQVKIYPLTNWPAISGNGGH